MRRFLACTACLALGVGVLCIGWSAIFVKFAGVPGPASAFYRMLAPALVLVPWRLARGGSWPSARLLGLIIVGGLFYALDLALWNSGILLTSASVATLLANNAPLWVGLGTWLLFRERLRAEYWLGLGLALAGMGVLMGPDTWHRTALGRGELLSLGASVAYAGYMLTAQKIRSRVDTLTFMTLSTVVSVLVLGVFNAATGTALAGYPARSWWALAGMGLISQLGGWLAINYALGHMRAAPVSVSLLAQAVVTALLAMPILGEYPARHQVLGGAVVLAGIYLVNRRGTRTEPERRSALKEALDGS